MSRRVTLAPAVTREDFNHAAVERGWRLHVVVEAGADVPYEEVWSVDLDASAAHYIEDALLGVSYVLAMGTNEEGVAQEIESVLATVRPRDAIEWTRQEAAKQDRLRAISYLASAATVTEEVEVTQAFARLLEDPDPDIRQHAIFAAAYPSWPELDPLLERVRATDPEPGIRAAADQALAAIRRHRNGDAS